jgi:DNA-binding YbaB/EbfC family protein
MAKRQRPPAGEQMGMLRRLQGIQKDILEAQEEIAAMTVSATAGGGAVTVVLSGDRRIRSLAIQPEVVDPDDVEMLQDLIVAAVNQGLEQLERQAADKMNAITGGLDVGLGLG